MKEPLRIIPKAVRPAVFQLWMCHKTKYGCDNELVFAAPLAIWIRRFGLTIPDAIEILEGMLDPAKFGAAENINAVTTMLAREVTERIRTRKAEDRRRAAEVANAAKNSVSLADFLRERGSVVSDLPPAKTAIDHDAAARSDEFARRVRNGEIV